MESILSRVINVPQTSRHKRIQHSDLTGTTTTFDIPLPKDAIVDQVVCLVKTVFNSNGAARVNVGDLVTGTAYMSAQDIKSAVGRFVSPVAKQMVAVQPYTATDDGEAEYAMRVTVIYASTAPTTGDMYVWCNYRFEPNEIYS